MSRAQRSRQFQDDFLPGTIQNAVAHFPYYERTLGPLMGSIRTIEDLSALPVLTRTEVLANLDDLVCAPQPDDLVTFTSGTTSGNAFMVRHSQSELRHLQDLWSQVFSEANIPDQSKPLILELLGNYHGIMLASQAPNLVRIPFTVEAHILAAIDILHSTFRVNGVERRVTALRGSLESLQGLTLYCAERGISLREFSVEQIAVSGHFLTDRWRSFLELQWGATIFDTYSLSEFVDNGAAKCSKCGYHHFLIPTVVAEVLHPISREPIQRGSGALVLTALYPFSQRQMLIRYWTGDLVERGPACVMDDFSFRIRGRIDACLLSYDDPVPDVLISSLALGNILDSIPDIDRTLIGTDASLPPFLEQSSLRQMSNQLCFEMTSERKTLDANVDSISIRIGLSYPPEMYPERSKSLEYEIERALLERSPVLAANVLHGRTSLDIQSVGSHSRVGLRPKLF